MPQATSGTARPSTSSSSGMGDTSAASPARSSGDRLPNTGSELPLVGVAGLLALAAALGVRAVRRAA
jgi:LPXTG-motif cell wall-anchored protein